MLSFKNIEKRWDDSSEIEDIVPKLVSRLISTLDVAFVGDGDINSVYEWLENEDITFEKLDKKFEDAVLVVRIFEPLTEAVIKVFKAGSDGRLIPAYKCIGGPKHGKKTRDPSVCVVPPSMNRRYALKKGMATKKGSIKLSRAKKAKTNNINRRKLTRKNKIIRKLLKM